MSTNDGMIGVRELFIAGLAIDLSTAVVVWAAIVAGAQTTKKFFHRFAKGFISGIGTGKKRVATYRWNSMYVKNRSHGRFWIATDI